MRTLLVLLALAVSPTIAQVAHAEAPASSQSLRERAKKLDADAATDRAQIDKAKKTAAIARKTAADKLAAAAKLKTQLASTTDPKTKSKLEGELAALEKDAAKNEDEATQLDAAIVALERRAKKLDAEAKRLRKQADAIDGK